MAKVEFDPGKILGDDIKKLSREELCELVSKLCTEVQNQTGSREYRGGLYPENISVDDDGNVAIGPARENSWEGRELEFLAPELYWNGQRGPASDVYSLGLTLYYAVSGKLPFDDSDNAQLKRMSGEDIAAPENAGRRLGEIIEKACRFKPAERYQTLEELKIVLDNCEKNNYIDSQTGSAAIFNKNNEELSDIERLMVDIIEGDKEQQANADIISEEFDSVEEAAEADVSEAEFDEETEVVSAETELPDDTFSPEPEAEPDDVTSAFEEEFFEEAAAEEPEGISFEETAFSEDEVISPEEAEEMSENEEDPEIAAIMAAAAVLAAAVEKNCEAPSNEGDEDVRVYNPGAENRENPAREPIPILTEEKNPELQPVFVSKQPVIMPAVQYSKSIERERKIAEEVKKRKRRPLAIVLSLSALLVIAAIIVNAMLNDISDKNSPVLTSPNGAGSVFDQQKNDSSSNFTGTVVVPTPGVTRTPEIGAEPTEPVEDFIGVTQPLPETPKESRYEVFVEDISWSAARDKCIEKGGHLAVISDEEEFNKIVEMVENAGINKVWLGCHRVEGTLVWENTDAVEYYPWDGGGPSYWDSYDGVAEEYLMLWYNDGWFYNDSRNDPVADYPQWYSGSIGYVCEFYE